MNIEERVKQAWSRYPEAVVTVETIRTGEKTPKVKSVPKNQLRVIVRDGRRSTLYVFKGALRLTANYRSGVDIETISDDDLRKLGILPHIIQHCTKCGAFSTAMYIGQDGLVCLDCLKSEKNSRSE